MSEIICPNCGVAFTVDKSSYAEIVRQVRDQQFTEEINARQKLMDEAQEQAIALAEAHTRTALQQDAAKKDARIAELESKLSAQTKAAEVAQQLAVEDIRFNLEAKIAELEGQLKTQKQSAAAQDQAFQAKLQTFETEKELAVARAQSALEKERDALVAQVELKELERKRIEASLKEQMMEKLQSKDEIIKYREDEISRLKDLRLKRSTKLVGESLEQHCENEFNKIRATAFPAAYFEKDNEVAQGTKGDYIFREQSADGVEIVSIMFEMKNEEDTTSTKHKNEDFFAKLDKDRTKKGCEYAVLVSMLEQDSELYNTGIVDVSYRYKKMYVIRPEFFIPMITLLRNAALNSLTYKQQLALAKQQNVDVENFEADLNTFKEGFFRNFKNASNRFNDAIAGIDKTISSLQKIREDLTKSEKHLTAANNKLDTLTIKKLTRKNPTMQEKFAELKEAESNDTL